MSDNVVKAKKTNKEVVLDEATFKTQYIASFLAAWTAGIYNDACMRSQHDRFDNQPVEDAEFLARKAWDQYVKKVS